MHMTFTEGFYERVKKGTPKRSVEEKCDQNREKATRPVKSLEHILFEKIPSFMHLG